MNGTSEFMFTTDTWRWHKIDFGTVGVEVVSYAEKTEYF